MNRIVLIIILGLGGPSWLIGSPFSAKGDSLLEVAVRLAPADQFSFYMAQIEELKKEDLPATQRLAEAAYGLAQSKGWPEKEIEALSQLMNATYLMGDYEQALAWEEIRMNLHIQRGDSLALARDLNFMANSLRKVQDQKRGLRLLDRAYRICLEAKDSVCLGINHDHRGLIFTDLYQIDSAEIEWIRCLAIRKQIKDTVGLGFIYDRLSSIAANRGDFPQSIAYQKQSLQIREQLGDEINQVYNFTNLGQIYYMSGNHTMALPQFEQAIQAAKEKRIPEMERHAAFYASKVALELGKGLLAYQYLAYSLNLKDSLMNAQKLRNIQELQAQFDSERKQREIEQVRARNKQLMLIGISSLIGLLLLGVIAYLFFRNRHQKRLQEQNLSHQQELLTATIQATDQERGRIAQDLHDSIGQQLVGLKMGIQQLAPEAPGLQIQKFANILSHITQEVRSLSHEMMPRSLGNMTMSDALSDVFERSFGIAGLPFHFEQVGGPISLTSHQKLSLYRIAQELSNNVLRHAKASKVEMLLSLHPHQIVFTMEDDGIGTQNEFPSEGIGLKNIQSRLQVLEGKFHTSQSAAGGTLTTVRFPINQQLN